MTEGERLLFLVTFTQQLNWLFSLPQNKRCNGAVDVRTADIGNSLLYAHAVLEASRQVLERQDYYTGEAIDLFREVLS